MKKPKKSLSQNFLIDKNIIKKILNLTKVKNKEILEIGPGYGHLTDIIIENQPKKIYLIEKDKYLFDLLVEKYKDKKFITVFNNDALNFDYNIFKNIIIISNLPYNIGTKVILKLFRYNNNILEMILMIQKEVAYKFDYNIRKINKYKFLTYLISNYNRCFNVSSNVFFPKPKVISSIVKFEFKNKHIDWLKTDNFIKIFKNKRKKLINNFPKEKILKKSIKDKRIEELNMKEILEIYNFF